MRNVFLKVLLREQQEYQEGRLSGHAKKCNNNCPVPNLFGGVANVVRCVTRNITMFIWPIEAILVLLNKKKIGDRIAGTNVVEV